MTLAREARLSNAASIHLAVLAWFAAIRGEDEGCRMQAAEVTDLARSTGKAVLVTGSSRGIGAELIKAFGKRGAQCVVNYVADPDGYWIEVNDHTREMA